MGVGRERNQTNHHRRKRREGKMENVQKNKGHTELIWRNDNVKKKKSQEWKQIG